MSNVKRKICKQKTRTSLDTINQTEPYGQLLGNRSDSPLQCWEQECMQQIVQPGHFKLALPILKGARCSNYSLGSDGKTKLSFVPEVV